MPDPHPPTFQVTDSAPLTNVIMDLVVDAICVVNEHGRFVYVNAACQKIFGYSPSEMVGRQMIDLVHPDDRARTLAAVVDVVAGVNKPNFENRYVRKDGRVVHIMWTARWSPVERVRVAVARDVTERKRAESLQRALYTISEATHAAEDLVALFRRIHQVIGELLPARNFFVALYDAASDRLSFPYHVDALDGAPADGRLDAGTASAEVIRTGLPLHLGRDRPVPPDAVQPDVGAAPVDWLGVPLSSQNGIIGALVVKSHDAEARYGEADVELLKFVSTQVAAAIERKQTEALLQHSARHDALTGLPNRALIFDRLTTALAHCQRQRSQLALLYLDLDRFKQVNDSYGHTVGDLMLQEAARRLKRCVRDSDTVGRIGGDEFVVLLAIQSTADAPFIAEKIRAALCEPFELAGHAMNISPSIGIAHYPDDGEDFERLILRADEAMYAAKRGGGNRYSVADGGRLASQASQASLPLGPDQPPGS